MERPADDAEFLDGDTRVEGEEEHVPVVVPHVGWLTMDAEPETPG
jgi:hypothetical protein